MPLATFRCRVSRDQVTVRLEFLRRRLNHVDVLRPVPSCPRLECARYGKLMQDVVQIDYGQGVS